MSAELFDALFDTLFKEDCSPKPYPDIVYHHNMNNYEIFKRYEQARMIACKDNRNMGSILGFIGHRELSPAIYKKLMQRGIVKKIGVNYVLDPQYEKVYGVTYHLYRGDNRNHRAINWYWKGYDLILAMARELLEEPLMIDEKYKF